MSASESFPRRSSARISMEEQLERLQDRGGRMSAVVRLIHCITGPRLRRQYFEGTEAMVSEYSGHYLELRLRVFLPMLSPYP